MESMKTALARVVEQKSKTKAQLAKLKNRYIATIYGGLCRRQSIEAIHKRLYDDTINQKRAGKAVSGALLQSAVNSLTYIHKRAQNASEIKKYAEDNYGLEKPSLSVALGFFVFDMMKRRSVERRMSKAIIKKADEDEAKGKQKVFEDAFRNGIKSDGWLPPVGEEVDTSKILIFYLASAHKDSASDHAPYQGKMYVDERWETIPLPYALRNAIAYYIRSHNVKTVQWVTGKPVWFITRPNCRHYFKQLSVQEVLATSKTRLLDKHDMKTAIGDRQYLQTIKHSTSKEWYEEVRNAELLVRSYRERLEMHEMMQRENPCELLKRAISKDKMLIDKWEKYIASRKSSS